MQIEKDRIEREAELQKQFMIEREKAIAENTRQMEQERLKELREILNHQESVMTQRMMEQQRLMLEGIMKVGTLVKEAAEPPPKEESSCVVM